MHTVALALIAICIASTTHARAASPTCETMTLEALSLACYLRAIEPVDIRLEGDAKSQGLERQRLMTSVDKRLKAILPVAITTTPADDEAFDRAALPLRQRGRLSCVVWTVGGHFPIALFVECGLESLDGEQSIEARLLGHTRRSELEETVRTALNSVVEKIARDLRAQRKRVRRPATRYSADTLN